MGEITPTEAEYSEGVALLTILEMGRASLLQGKGLPAAIALKKIREDFAEQHAKEHANNPGN